jgi:hypothetical protein
MEVNPTPLIAAHQGFFVKAKQSADNLPFTFDNHLRLAGGTFLKKTDDDHYVVLRLANADFFDYTVIRLRDQSSFDRDRLDALKAFSHLPEKPQLYSLTKDNVAVAVNSLPQLDSSIEILLSVRVATDETLSLGIEDISGHFAGHALFIFDKKTGQTSQLTQNAAYSFAAFAQDDKQRFVLKFGNVGIDENQSSSGLQIFMSGQSVYVLNPFETTVKTEVFSSEGRHVASRFLAPGWQSIEFSSPAGIYLLRLIGPTNVLNGKFVKSH